MCGIAGIYSINGSPVSNITGRIHQMADLLQHRGPDCTDFNIDPVSYTHLTLPTILLV